ncbi:hypothetical protein B7494_g4220 [Chlorociboria aeruginascens]|nr:hypothetical protein B7494_g4220 [Chlorociboria aeruginascens]
MGDPIKSYVVHFPGNAPDDSGYIMVEPLAAGKATQADLHVVRSLKNGQLYVRKHLVYGELNPELKFFHRLPSHIVPRLVHYEHHDSGDVNIYDFANGGDLLRYMNLNREKRQNIPEIMVWRLCRDISAILAYMHTGWTPESGTQDGWVPIAHHDLHSSNIFLHWTNSHSLFPKFLLGDWGYGREFKENEEKEELVFTKWNDIQIPEIVQMREILIRQVNWWPTDSPPLWNIEDQDNPAGLMNRLVNESIELALLKNGLKEINSAASMAVYIAEKMYPEANKHIKRLKKENEHDFRWTIPEEVTGFAIFGENGDREEDIKEWVKHKQNEEMRKPWQWLEVGHLPDIVTNPWST